MKSYVAFTLFIASLFIWDHIRTDGYSVSLMIVLIISIVLLCRKYKATKRQRAQEAAEAAAMEKAMAEMKEYEDAQRRQKEEAERLQREARIAEYKAKLQAFSDALAAIPATEVPTTQEAKRKRHRTTADMPAMGSPTITAKSKPERFANFVVVDTETTGLSADKDKIIELAAVRFESWQPVEVWSTYINPRKHIPEKASDINYIYDEDVADAPYIEDAKESFEAFVSKSDLLVGQNISFDLRFLWCDNIDFPEGMRCLDTVKLARKAYSLPNYKLGTIAEHCGILFSAHRALADAYATGLVFISCVRDLTRQDAPEALQDPE